VAIGCKNCGSYLSRDELAKLRPPPYPWPLTAVGQRIANENVAQGNDTMCPTCGCKTLR